MAMRAKLSVLGAALAGFFILVGGAAPASAHAGHDHNDSATVQVRVPVAVTFEAVAATASDEAQSPTRQEDSQADLTTTPSKIPAPVHQGNCCCGSIACHAGVEAPAPAAMKHVRLSARVEPMPVFGMAKTNPHGIDRPPRSLPL